MMAIGAGGLDVAVAMGSALFFLTYPKVVRIELKGRLGPWVSAKDVALTVLGIFGTQGNAGYVLEYGGEGAKSLSVPERATITNMGTECGVTTSIFPSDERTKEFLRAQGRDKEWVSLEADEGASYDRVVEIDLREVVPRVACPHSPGNVRTVREMAGLKVDQVCIGSCTNSSYCDLTVVSKILKGNRVDTGVSAVVAPGSRQVLLMLARESALETLLSCGFRLQESACGFCNGVGQSPGTRAISVRTGNRNFLGRTGTPGAEVYLVSPETAAATAIKGKLTDPRDLGMMYPHVDLPERFIVDDSLFIPPAERWEEVEVYRGPHMGQVPLNSPLPEKISGEVTIKLGDQVTTDHIVPSGSRLKYRANVAKYAEFLFERVDPSFHRRATEIRDGGRHNIIVAGMSYGQGSSREHAALCPMYLGVKAVVAKSLERIHRSNLINFGIIPFTFVKVTDYEWIEQGDELEIPEVRRMVQNESRGMMFEKTKGRWFEVSIELSERERQILLEGGALSYMKKIEGQDCGGFSL
jgi:aconitate hydratase